MKCRFCSSYVDKVFVDLGHQPPSNAYLDVSQLKESEKTFPLVASVCENCWLVQLPSYGQADELFTGNYAYFSSVSTTWLDHAKRYVESVIPRFNLGGESLVIEVASNDGYLLQYVRDAGISCVGIEPTASTAAESKRKGIDTIEEFFGTEFARAFVNKESRNANLLVANNVLAHVPDLNDFVSGIALILAEDGVASFEFPHLLRLSEGMQFDTIYHEHYSYFSFYTVSQILGRHGLKVFDVEELPTHGGSLRVFASPTSCDKYPVSDAVEEMLERESLAGMRSCSWYEGFQLRVEELKDNFLRFLLDAKSKGKAVVGYGAAAKGNTLLNFAGVRSDLLPYICDAAPSKQGKFMPGNHIPIKSPDILFEKDPDYVVVLPWNIIDEVVDSISGRLPSHCRFVTAVPQLRIRE